jgi:hypothetical protein
MLGFNPQTHVCRCVQGRKMRTLALKMSLVECLTSHMLPCNHLSHHGSHSVLKLLTSLTKSPGPVPSVINALGSDTTQHTIYVFLSSAIPIPVSNSLSNSGLGASLLMVWAPGYELVNIPSKSQLFHISTVSGDTACTMDRDAVTRRTRRRTRSDGVRRRMGRPPHPPL